MILALFKNIILSLHSAKYNLRHSLLSNFILFLILGFPSILLAYVPGASYVSLTDDQGLFANPAGVSAFDSKGGLFTYQYSEEKVHQMQLGFNLGALGFSFDYQTHMAYYLYYMYFPPQFASCFAY